MGHDRKHDMLTVKFIKSLEAKTNKQPYRKSDSRADPGFGIQVSGRGVKTFYQRYTWTVTDPKDPEKEKQERRFYDIGRFTGDNLKAARKESKRIRALVTKGIEPREDQEKRIREQNAEMEERKKEERRQAAAGTVKQLFDEYKKAPSKRNPRATKRSASQVGRIYDRDIGPAIGSVKARAVTESHIDDMLDDIMERGAKVLANRAHAYLKAAFNFGIKWDRKNSKRKKVSFGIASNPVEHIEKPYAGEKPRNRWLTADEIHECWGEWQDPEMISLPLGIALRLLLATAGQRVEEVLEAPWEEFHLTEEEPFWLIPPERAKNGNEHYVPLTQLALDLLAEAREHCGDSLYLFPMTKDTKRPMDSNYLGGHLREYCKRSDVQKFTARDMRRTAKTHMAQLQPVKLAQSDDQPDSWLPVTLEMRNRIQNHAFSDIGSQVYDCWTYIPEKRAVLLALEQRLRNIISESPESKVVPIEKAKEKRWQA